MLLEIAVFLQVKLHFTGKVDVWMLSQGTCTCLLTVESTTVVGTICGCEPMCAQALCSVAMIKEECHLMSELEPVISAMADRLSCFSRIL